VALRLMLVLLSAASTAWKDGAHGGNQNGPHADCRQADHSRRQS